jgi:hypothetical protein
MSDSDLGDWSPTSKVVFTDEELVRRLRDTLQRPAERSGNWWAFFSALPAPERQRLEAEAAQGPGE